MLGTIAALALFGAIALLVHGRASAGAEQPPRRLPDPGARDLHAVTGITLARAHVPSWG